jgi:hypothetical protein
MCRNFSCGTAFQHGPAEFGKRCSEQYLYPRKRRLEIVAQIENLHDADHIAATK